ncbi:Hypothetical_protein [Hexamita inflata]|uniref:Hypothetical_protein n=1 Tax=Hexamita inflata TaxID=28002 RepID=A0ABP1HV48_9EUKA
METLDDIVQILSPNMHAYPIVVHIISKEHVDIDLSIFNKLNLKQILTELSRLTKFQQTPNLKLYQVAKLLYYKDFNMFVTLVASFANDIKKDQMYLRLLLLLLARLHLQYFDLSQQIHDLIINEIAPLYKLTILEYIMLFNIGAHNDLAAQFTANQPIIQNNQHLQFISSLLQYRLLTKSELDLIIDGQHTEIEQLATISLLINRNALGLTFFDLQQMPMECAFTKKQTVVLAQKLQLFNKNTHFKEIIAILLSSISHLLTDNFLEVCSISSTAEINPAYQAMIGAEVLFSTKSQNENAKYLLNLLANIQINEQNDVDDSIEEQYCGYLIKCIDQMYQRSQIRVNKRFISETSEAFLGTRELQIDPRALPFQNHSIQLFLEDEDMFKIE